mmetsp:Transcript_41752/g.83690  ORF Transcript_41752/g.83690 Transcript_41752/m.83690 type:complete len:230 (-) Transcript_41752:92-781(-)
MHHKAAPLGRCRLGSADVEAYKSHARHIEEEVYRPGVKGHKGGLQCSLKCLALRLCHLEEDGGDATCPSSLRRPDRPLLHGVVESALLASLQHILQLFGAKRRLPLGGLGLVLVEGEAVGAVVVPEHPLPVHVVGPRYRQRTRHQPDSKRVTDDLLLRHPPHRIFFLLWLPPAERCRECHASSCHVGVGRLCTLELSFRRCTNFRRRVSMHVRMPLFGKPPVGLLDLSS